MTLVAKNTITPNYRSQANDILLMSADALQEWKSRIREYQQGVINVGGGRMAASITSAVIKTYIIAIGWKRLLTLVFSGILLLSERRTRQQLELNLIQKRRSPFNKENWQQWGQPFN